MSSYRMRIALDEDDTESPEVQLLDWRPGSSVSTVQVGKAGARFFEGWRPRARPWIWHYWARPPTAPTRCRCDA